MEENLLLKKFVFLCQPMSSSSSPNIYSPRRKELKQTETETHFPLKYEEYKRLSKGIYLQKTTELETKNQFTDDEEFADWVVISQTNKDGQLSPRLSRTKGFLECFFDPIVSKRKIKYMRHWITLEDHYLTCYQSKVSYNNYN